MHGAVAKRITACETAFTYVLWSYEKKGVVGTSLNILFYSIQIKTSFIIHESNELIYTFLKEIYSKEN